MLINKFFLDWRQHQGIKAKALFIQNLVLQEKIDTLQSMLHYITEQTKIQEKISCVNPQNK